MGSLRRFIVPILVTSITGVALLLSPIGSSLEQSVGLKWLFNLRGPISAPSSVIIVSIDADSAVLLDQPSKLRDWDRKLHADLIRKLSERGADVIVFDVFFDESRANDGDTAFAHEIKDSNRVVLAQMVQRDPISESMTIDRLLHPTPMLKAAAFGLAPFPLPRVQNRFGQFWTFYSGVSYSSTLPVVALQARLLRNYGYEKYVDLLKAANFPASAQLPEQVRKVEDMQRLMTLLRVGLRSNTSAVENLRSQALTFYDQREVGASTTKTLQALINAYAGGDSYFLNFYGPPETITTIPYSAFWDSPDDTGKTSLSDLSGKVVFIGGTAQTSSAQTDRFFTVFSGDNGDDIAGVEIAATAYANLLENETIRPATVLTNLALVVIFGGIVGYLGYRLASAWAVPAILMAGAVYAGVAHYLFASSEIWIAVFIPIAVQLSLAMVTGYLLQYLQARRAIGLYVPKHVALEFDKGHDPATAPEERFFGICMSTDIQDYTTVNENISGSESAELMNEYFGLLMPCVQNHQGQVIEVRGDSMNSVWPAMTHIEDLSSRACLAACDILRAVDRFNKDDPTRQLPTRIGLHAGEYSLRNVGGGGHLAFCVHGDTIITASRIQELSKTLRTRLLASESVVQKLEGWLFRRVCDFQPKGKTEILPIYEVLGPQDTVTHEDQELCNSFVEAMRMLEESNWSEAAQSFASILTAKPNDGPSLFYLARCQYFQNSPPPANECTMIRANQRE